MGPGKLTKIAKCIFLRKAVAASCQSSTGSTKIISMFWQLCARCTWRPHRQAQTGGLCRGARRAPGAWGCWGRWPGAGVPATGGAAGCPAIPRAPTMPAGCAGNAGCCAPAHSTAEWLFTWFYNSLVFNLSTSVARPLYRAEGLLADALDAKRLAAAEAAPIRIEYNEKGRTVGKCRAQGPSTVEKTSRVIDRPASAAPPMPLHQAIIRTTTCSKLRSPRDSASMCSR